MRSPLGGGNRVYGGYRGGVVHAIDFALRACFRPATSVVFPPGGQCPYAIRGSNG